MKHRLVSVLFAFSFCLSLDAAEVSPAPAASDPSTPLPEQGRVIGGRYRNTYFGLSYPLAAGWSEQPAGRLPADDGSYVLTRFALYDGEHHLHASGSLAAQDHFFGAEYTCLGSKTLSPITFTSSSTTWRKKHERYPSWHAAPPT